MAWSACSASTPTASSAPGRSRCTATSRRPRSRWVQAACAARAAAWLVLERAHARLERALCMPASRAGTHACAALPGQPNPKPNPAPPLWPRRTLRTAACMGWRSFGRSTTTPGSPRTSPAWRCCPRWVPAATGPSPAHVLSVCAWLPCAGRPTCLPACLQGRPAAWRLPPAAPRAGAVPLPAPACLPAPAADATFHANSEAPLGAVWKALSHQDLF